MASRERPLVTVGLPVRNGAEFIEEAIESVLGQTFDDFELLIFDNASDDNTENLCRQFVRQDSRVRYRRRRNNVGLSRNYNDLVHHAQTEFFKWISHDDYIDSRFLEVCVKELRRDPTLITVAPAAIAVDASRATIRRIGPIHGQQRSWGPDPIARHRQMIRELEDECNLGGVRRLLETYVYGLHRRRLLARTSLLGTFIQADSVLAAELPLYGGIVDVPEALNYLRFHLNPESSQVHFLTANYGEVLRIMDPRSPQNPVGQAIAQRRAYAAYFSVALRAPLSPTQKLRACGSSAIPSIRRARERLREAQRPE